MFKNNQLIQLSVSVLLILSFICFSCTLSYAQDIEIPDEVFLAKLIEAGVDTNEDGIIQMEEALARTNLGVASNLWDADEDKIHDIEGIQYFTNLVTFSCRGNKITTLDVTALSNLEVLHCQNNELTSLQVNDLSLLETLWAYNNQLTEIDLTGLESLWFLFINNNQLSEIDLTNLESLVGFWSSYNQLTNVDFSTNLLLEDVDVSHNNLNSLEINHLNNLSILYCLNNNITEIDLHGMESLYHLDISHNLLTEIDGSQSPNFTKLHCSGNSNLTHINMQNDAISYTWTDSMPYYSFMFMDLPSLNLVCIDEGEEVALAESGYDADNVAFSISDCTFSTADLLMNDLVIYPNPVSTQLYIQAEEATKLNFEIFNLKGEKILSDTYKEMQSIDVSVLSKGTYLLKIETEHGSFTKIFIKN